LVATLRFMARYYHVPLGQVVRATLSAPLRRTGLGDDVEDTRQQDLVGATFLRPWPDDLSRAEVRLLHRIEAEGAIALRELRRKTPGSPALQASGAAVVGLQRRGLVDVWQERVMRDPLGMRQPAVRDAPPTLTDEQSQAVAAVCADLDARRYAGHLLHGVTGCGKTEVYLHIIARALQQGRTAVVLVPEIALTPQLVQRFRARFGEPVAALHSAMSEGERTDTFERIRSGAAHIVIGPRSALFAPLANLGAVVVDECHDSSFKQQSGLRYHARDVALVRAQAAQAVCILGSATPSCEELQLVTAGRLALQVLSQRPRSAQMPQVRTLDLRLAERLVDPQAPDRPSLLSHDLLGALRDTVARGDQAMLLHNRRGFATSMLCAGCGTAVECPECAVALTWHHQTARLRCHWCDLSIPDAISCPQCAGRNWIGIGAGTERIEATLAHHLPGVRVARLDRDTAAGQRLLDTLQRFRDREIDVLVGTQMLAKGHDFPRVTRVGVVLAEAGLTVPDFRASERTYQLLTQVAGRAGRAERPGTVLIQTFKPDHPAIAAVLAGDSAGFAERESRARRDAGYPPWMHLALVEVRHPEVEVVRAHMERIAAELRAAGAEVRGPVMASVARLRGIWRIHALLRSVQRPQLHQWLRHLHAVILPGLGRLPSGLEVVVDVDPQGLE
ncbi:MAG: primosomal protein N', partial [Deltaproteobacteria bacterium]|nr:primosomal protein N' [Deltaproteobacteria bacterium]